MITYTYSPLIDKGRLSLNANGDLTSAPDILTQMSVTLTAYNCIYNKNIDSKVLFNLSASRNTLTKAIINAYKVLIAANVIRSPEVFIKNIAIGIIGITINVLDIQGNQFTLSWNNPQ